MIKKIIFLIFILLDSALGHPHTFIELFSDVSKQNNNIKVHIKWYFDEMTSNMFLMDFDANKNNQFEDKEKSIIQKEAFEHLLEFSYYAYIEADKKQMKTKAQNFSTYIDKNKVVYEFDLLLDVATLDKNLNITFKDKDMYIAFILNKNSNTSQDNIKTKLSEIKNDYTLAYKLEITK